MRINDIVKLKLDIPELKLTKGTVGKVIAVYDSDLCLIEIDNKDYILTTNQVSVMFIRSLWHHWNIE